MPSAADAIAYARREGERDRAFFAAFFFPDYIPGPIPAFHHALFAALAASDRDTDFVLPRGSAKTTLISKIGTLHDLCYGAEPFTAIFSNTDGQAVTILGDIRRNLKTNPRLLAAFGDLLDASKPGVRENDHEIVTANGCCVRVGGSGTETRGWTFGPHRPTKIVLDDFESRDTVATKAQRDKLAAWLYADVIPMRDKRRSRVLTVGTILHQDAVLQRRIKSGATDVFFRKSILREPDRADLWAAWERAWQDGGKEAARAFYAGHREDMDAGAEVLWPAVVPYVALAEERRAIGPFAFQTEYQNDPVPDDAVVIRRAWVEAHRPRFIDGEKPYILDGHEVLPLADLTVFGSVDAAISKRTQADYSVLLTGGLHRPTNRVYVWEAVRAHYNSPELIRAIVACYERWDHHRIGIESVAYQAAIKQLVDVALTASGRRIPTEAVTPQADKVVRLSRWQSQFEQGLVRLCDTVPSACVDELTSFPIAEHDDVPDATSQLLLLAYGGSVAENLYKPFRGRI